MKPFFTYLKQLSKKPQTLVLFLLVFFTTDSKLSFAGGYCIPNYYYYSCCSIPACDDYIRSFNLTGYSGSSITDATAMTGCISSTYDGYFDRTSAVPAVNLEQGGSYAGSITFNSGYEMIFQIWIDFNNDSVFTPDEEVTTPNAYNPCCTSYTPTYSYTLNLPITAATGKHRMRVRSIYTFSPPMTNYIDPCGEMDSTGTDYYYYGTTDDYNVNIVAAPPCSGTPVVTVSPTGTVVLCSGGSETYTGSAGIYSGLKFFWQQLVGSTWTSISGDTTPTATFIASGSTQYRIGVLCTASGDTAYSTAATLASGLPSYASLPYFQDFENWENYCGTSDVPDGSWSNRPATGDSSWRRDDQGSTAGWGALTSGESYTTGSFYKSGSHSARFHSYYPPYAFFSTSNPPYSGNLDLYVNCSGSTGNKELYFYFVNTPYPYAGSNYALYNNDSLIISLSTDGGTTFNQIWGGDTAKSWTRVAVPIVSNSATTIIRFQGKRLNTDPLGYGYNYDYTDIGLDSVYVAPPCSGTPTAGYINPGGTLTVCPGTTNTFNLVGTSLAGNLKYQWKQSTDGGVTWTNATGRGDTTLTFTTPPLFSGAEFECIVSCPLSGTSATTSPVTVNMSGFSPTYASVPYTQSFENWISRCYTYDIPDSSWANSPGYGDNSWRREDQGTSYSCWYPYSSKAPAPPSVDGKHCASIQTDYAYYDCSYNQPNLTPGNLYLLVNCNTSTPGNKELQFYLNNPTPLYSYPNDSFLVWLSTDNGVTFKEIGSYGTTTSWQFESLPIASNSPQTVILFQTVYKYQYSDVNNMGLDLVKVLPPCQDKPTAGTVNNVTPCSGTNFNLSLTGVSQAAGLSYVWQSSGDGSSWTTLSGDTLPVITQNITANTYYRAIVTCTNSGLSDTTASQLIKLAPFYICYCDPTKNATNVNVPSSSVNNFSILRLPKNDSILDFGKAVPVDGSKNPWEKIDYVAYDTIPNDSSILPTLYRDSLYQFYVTVGSYNSYDYNYNTPVNIYLDLNHNGQYDPAEEIFDHRLGGSCCTSLTLANATVTDTFRIADTTLIGVTGLRVMTGYGQSDPISPCGESYYENQDIDFLVNIDYRPCDGPVAAGIAQVSDSTMCVGYSYMVIDTTHEHHQSKVTWNWQTSPDGISWGDIPGMSMTDTFTVASYIVPTWYRLRVICNDSHDTTYSKVAHVGTAPAYACYCYSMATGGSKYDSSDIGAFTIGTYLWDKGGPHILNPVAVNGRTDHTGDVLDLYADSTYPVSVYQILKSAEHADSKITLFMDFNNNLVYDVPDERVWTTYTTASDWYLTTSLTIPDAVITEVPTGMRLILNNNTAPNSPSDDGCGAYASGETEDFVVKFHKGPIATSVGSINNIEHLSMYPNPTSGKFTVEFTANNVVKDLQISISNVTGQQVMQRSYTNTSGQFSTQLDMSNQPRGIYVVELIADGQRMLQKLIIR
ncbi:MAG TPA: T9SS type A sorting domain-containing protein [Flavipsychrobacter sp.]|nr:T9SS type A sorting domain-containing protein [Flavipsychrobacter sp.]